MTKKSYEVILNALAEKISQLENDNKLKDYQIESLKKKIEEAEKHHLIKPTTTKLEIR